MAGKRLFRRERTTTEPRIERAHDEARMALGTPEQAADVRRAYDIYEDRVFRKADSPDIAAALAEYRAALDALPPLPTS
jgi:hypothetical protein